MLAQAGILVWNSAMLRFLIMTVMLLFCAFTAQAQEESVFTDMDSEVEAIVSPVAEAQDEAAQKPRPPQVKTQKAKTQKLKPKKKKVPKPAAAIVEEPADIAPVHGTMLAPEEARRIALSIAPPARSMQVFEWDHSGRPVYNVVFKTEDGEKSVLVDKFTGDIVNPSKSAKKRKK